MADRHARNGEVLNRPLGVNAPVGAVRDVVLAEQIMLPPGVGRRQRDRVRPGNNQGFAHLFHSSERVPTVPAHAYFILKPLRNEPGLVFRVF
jgi:hypothetical protein